jgi:hypothetical protein
MITVMCVMLWRSFVVQSLQILFYVFCFILYLSCFASYYFFKISPVHKPIELLRSFSLNFVTVQLCLSHFTQ